MDLLGDKPNYPEIQRPVQPGHPTTPGLRLESLKVVIDADTRLVVAVGRPPPGNRNDCKAWELSGAKDAVGKTTVIADGGYRGTGLVIPHRREKGQTELPDWKEEHNAAHRKVRARVEHAFARMKTWKILRDCRLKGDGVTTRCSESLACTA
jgi:hypothetical protein